MIGLGLALAQPERRVLVLTGDGEALMGLGSLATIGVKGPQNLVARRARQPALWRDRHAAEPHRAPASTSPPSPWRAASPTRCTFATQRCRTCPRSRASGHGPILVQARIADEDAPRVLPLRDGHAIKQRFVAALGALS